jgi:cysteine rich repeat protein
MMHRRTGTLLVVCAILLAIPTISSAQAGGPCRDDIQRLCKNAGPAGVRGCMREHASELSPACKARLAEVKERMKQHAAALKQACQGDIEKYCSQVPPGPLRVAQCLHDHEAQLSKGCTTAMAQRPGHMGATPPPSATAHPK